MKTFNYLFTLLLFCFWGSVLGQDSTVRPNVVFILADDLGWSDLPVYGNRFNEAPNISKLAKEGLTFDQAYAANPVCSPTRASIQTGQYPARIGMNDWIPGHWRPFEKVLAAINEVQFLPETDETLGEMMRRAGYRTGYFGKWHLGHEQEFLPENRGYDSSVVFQSAPYFDFQNSLVPKREFDKEKILSEVLTDWSIEFISENRSRPFFLFLSHFDVHVQLDAQKDLIEKYQKKEPPEDYPGNAVYAAMIENLDKSVGRIMKKLKELNLEENTLIVFFSDNGGLVTRFDKAPLIAERNAAIYENDTLLYVATSNTPLRGEKGALYEGGVRVPLIMKWPKRIGPDQRSQHLVSSIDFFPTLASVAGDSQFDADKIDGISLETAFEQKNSPEYERSLFWHYPVYHHSSPASSIRKGKYKLIEFYDDEKGVELYDLESDLSETNNLAQQEPERANKLLEELHQWKKSVKAEEPVPNPDFIRNKRQVWGKHPDSK